MNTRPLTFVNARLGAREAASLRLVGARIAAMHAPPAAGDVVMDVAGDLLLPGLVNAHDHLQLNNFPRLRFREHHQNVAEWIADIDTRRGSDRAIAAPAAVPRERRLLHGGFKNILAGVTTVAHHDPYYPSLQTVDFPCRVLARYGWAHSLGIDGDDKVRESCRATPAQTPWFVHAGEGVDANAAAEFTRLERLGCIGANTRLIHGVAFSADDRARLAASGAALVWCPSSNFHLFGETADCADLIARGRVALGSDSRLSGERDLLDELRVAHDCCGIARPDLEAMVTTVGARLLGVPNRGALWPGLLADCIVLPRDRPLGVARRADLRCVMLGGVMMCGDPDYADVLMPVERRVPVTLDNRVKVLDRGLADQWRAAGLQEAGLRLDEQRGQAA